MRKLFLPTAVVAASVTLAFLLFSGPATAQSPAPTSGVTLTDSAPTAAQIAEGAQLFSENCSSCHGPKARGSSLAPNLEGVGAEIVDLWVSSGWMPLAVPTAEPIRKPDRFSPAETVDIADFVGSFGGPAIPTVDLSGANEADGFSLFTLNCAPCHTITGAGDALSNGLSAPPLHGVTPLQVLEAIETGPGNMPRFVPSAITPAQAKDVVAFVTRDIEHPAVPGGLALGGVGPVAEGFIGLFVGVGICLLIAYWIGDRSEREDRQDHEHGEPVHV